MYKSKNRGYTTIDLFAGVGGIRLGFEQEGFTTLFANDYERHCKTTYDLNFSDPKLVIKDINEVELTQLPKKFDGLLGGFPCQPFSVAGYRKGFKDKKGRGNLFFRIMDIVSEKKPNFVFLENVKNLKGHDGGRTYKTIKQSLEGEGYHVTEAVLNTMLHGNLPQNRERIYIVGFKNKKAFEHFVFPRKIPLSKNFKQLLEKEVDEKYYYNGKPLFKKLKNHVTSTDTVYQWRRKYVRENKKSVCPTLTANMGMGGHNVPIVKDKKGIRKLTPLECARIQGFFNIKLPDDLPDSALYKQFGNSVSVPVIRRIAKNIFKALQA